MIALNAYTLIDTVILGVMRPDAEVGWYAASYRIYDGLTYPPSIIAALLTPRLSFLFVNDRPAHRRMLMLGLAGSMTLGVVLGGAAILVAAPLVVLLFGSRLCARRRRRFASSPAARFSSSARGFSTRPRSRRTSIAGCC